MRRRQYFFPEEISTEIVSLKGQCATGNFVFGTDSSLLSCPVQQVLTQYVTDTWNLIGGVNGFVVGVGLGGVVDGFVVGGVGGVVGVRVSVVWGACAFSVELALFAVSTIFSQFIARGSLSSGLPWCFR